jgi:hypothetical protein
VPDVQLDDGRDRRHRPDVVETQSVAGVAFEADLLGVSGGGRQPF